MAATLEIHFLTLKYTHCQFCQNYPKKVAKIKLILAKLAFATNYEVCLKPFTTMKFILGYMFKCQKPVPTHIKVSMIYHNQ
jgi:hypothetical protein